MPMPRRRITAAWLMFLLGTAAAVAFGEGKRAKEIEAIFERARTQSQLEVEGGAPYRLEATVYEQVGGAKVAGHYMRTWQSKRRWRDEMMFTRYSQVRVMTESALWRRRDTNRQPSSVVQFLQGLGFNLPRTPAQEPKKWDSN